MNFFKRIGDWLGITPPKQKAEINALRDLLELGRQARYSENYRNALEIFENAVDLAQTRGDSTALVIARLNIADTYLHMEDFESAEDLLIDLENDTEKRQHHTPLGYTLCLMGYLHQLQDNWELARTYYNRAKALAERTEADGVLGRAKGHLADTYLREGNANYAEHLLREALPLLDKTDDIELSSHFVGQYALTMLELGHETDGDRLLDTALLRAKRLNYTQQIRYWNRIIAERKLEKQDYQDALHHYQDFIELSPKPLPVTELYGIALSNMSEITRHLGQQDEALDYAIRAEKILSQLESITLSSQALMTIGLAMRANHDYDNALSYFEQAKSSATEEQARSLDLEIAQTHATAGNFDLAQASYQQLLDRLDEDSEHRPRALSGLGNTYRQQKKLEEAITQWKTALKLSENASDNDQTARLICDIAQARYELGDGKRALADYERALMLLNSVDKETRGIIMSNVAIAYADKGDVPTTESFFTEAIEIAHELQNPTAEAMRRNNYAMFLIDIGQAQRAVISIEHAQKLLQEGDNTLYRAIFTDNLGVAFRALGKPDKALTQHQLAEKHFQEIDATDWEHLNHLNFVETYLDLDQLEDTDYHLHDLPTDTIDVVIQHHLTSARYHLATNDLDTASNHISQAITRAQSGYRQRLLAKSLVIQSKIQAQLGDKESANATWQSAEKLLNLLQMPVLNPNWLHVPSESDS